MRRTKRLLAFILSFCMILSMSTAVFATEPETVVAETTIVQETEVPETETVQETESEIVTETETEIVQETEINMETDANKSVMSINNIATMAVESLDSVYVTSSKVRDTSNDPFYKIAFLDCGRKYFTVAEIKQYIDNAAEAGFNYVQLAVGNDGLRFLLDDMAITVDGTTYQSDVVKAGIKQGNKNYAHAGELSQSDMTEIITYANSKNVSIIPLLNTPGHMDAIIDCMEYCGLSNVAYSTSQRTIDVTNATAVAFTQEVVKKYAAYFATQGCTIFNMGADEYANDTDSMGFPQLISSGKYSYFVKYINSIAAIIRNAGMTPMAFNDGIYYNQNTTTPIDKNIIVSYWSSGWNGYNVASASFLDQQGFKLVNTNGDYYWVLGKSDVQCTPTKAAQFDINTFMGSTIENPEGAMFCIWCDFPDAGTADSVLTGSKATLAAFGKTLPATESGSGNVGSTVDQGKATVDEAITLYVGGETVTKTQADVNNAGNVNESEYDQSIAKVTVTGQDAVEGKINYTSVKPTVNQMISQNSTSWKKTNYYYQVDGNYYPVYAKRSYSNIRYNFTWGYSVTDSANNVQQVETQNNIRSRDLDSTNVTISVFTQSGITAGTPASTTITFKPVSAGTTYYTVGDVRYVITVHPEDLSSVAPLNIEYWITNGPCTDANNANSYSVSATMTGIYSEEGVAVETFLPAETTRESRTKKYWRCRILDTKLANSSTSGTEQQTEDGGDDDTYSGSTFTKVRYYEGKWAVYTTEWVEVESKHQLVAYYLENIKVCDEVTAYAADWGKMGDGSASSEYLDPAQYCTVSIQVVYDDGTTNPAGTTAKDLKSKTIVYGYWTGGRGIGTIMFEENNNYEIYKVDAETGAATGSGSMWGSFDVSGLTWDNNNKTVWEGTSENGRVSIHNEASNPNGTDPYDNLMWDENKEAILLRVYVRAKITEDSLTVHYCDRTANDTEFYNYNIAVQQGTLFNEGFALNGSNLVNNTVTNINNVTQTVQSDLSTMPAIGAQYRHSKYQIVDATRSADGKDVYLYYTFDNTKSYVVDFGLPMTFTLQDVSTSLASSNISIDSVSLTGAKYGTATYNAADKSITYTPKSMINGAEVINMTVTGYQEIDGQYQTGTVSYRIYIYPATTVFYEESFLTKDANWTASGNNTATQETEALGSKANNYGYDSSYTTANDGSYIESTALGATASFAFTGTGVNLYTNNTTGTGRMSVTVKDANNKLKKLYTVNTVMANGTSDATSGQEINDKSFPSVSLLGMAHGNYNVTIKSFKLNTETEAKPIRIDGVRVYDTISGTQAATIYDQDGEASPSYYNLRNSLLTAYRVTDVAADQSIYVGETNGIKYYVDQVYDKTEGEANIVTYISGQTAAQTNIADYLDNGPKNQIYIQPGDAITFNVPACADAQLGLKAIGGTVNASINNKSVEVNANTDMFYSVTAGNVTVANPTGSTEVLAVTDLKVIGAGAQAAMEPLTNDQIATAAYGIMLMSLMSEEPVAPIEPATVDAVLNISVMNWDEEVLGTTSLSKNGVEGEAVTFTEAEIKAAVEAMELPEGYTYDTLKYYDVQTIYGETASFDAYAEVVEVEEPATKDATLTVVVKTMFGKEIARDVLVYSGAEGENYTFSKTDVKAVVNTLAKENGYQPSVLNNYKAVKVTCGESKEVTYKASFFSSLFR